MVLDNGDRITGEVLELSSGQLKFKTDHLGTLYIDWTHIVSLTTTQRLNIELLDGKRLHGAAPDARVGCRDDTAPERTARPGAGAGRGADSRCRRFAADHRRRRVVSPLGR